MGRRETPVDPNAGPVQRFAFELRKLRHEAGGLTYREMARRAHYSVTALSQAAAGEQLPSLAVTVAYVKACGGDPKEWERRWAEASEESAVRDRTEDAGRSPYQGLARFEPDDHDRFFGRDELVAALRRLTADRRFSAVFGPSGSGKSSLLRAGLVPALREHGAGKVSAIRILTPGDQPSRTHAEALLPAAGDGDTVIVVDQFEEVFTLCNDPAERAAFIDRLLTAQEPDSRLRVVIAVRADFYGRCAEHRALADALSDAGLLVGPMTPAELREAVVKPAQTAGLIVERELTARVVGEVAGEPGGLPLMSHVLHETWRRRRGRALTVRAYEAAGGLHGAIAQTAEDVHAGLSAPQAELARLVLLRLISPGEGSPDTRRPAARNELELSENPEDVAVVLDRLARARLITLDEDTVDLAHEALITGWPRLRAWIEEDRERLRVHRRLTEAARTWDGLGRDPGALYRGTRLDTADEVFAAGHETALTPLERSFLDAARTARTRDRNRRRGLFGVLAVLVVLALLAGALAWQQNRESDRRREEAAALRVASVADSLRGSDPVLAMRLSMAAWRVSDRTETRASLMEAATRPEADSLSLSVTDEYEHLLLSDDGRTLVGAGERIRAWDVVAHREREVLAGQSADLAETGGASERSVDLSPDGREALVSVVDGPVYRYRVPSGEPVGEPFPGLVSAVFNPSGRTLTAASWEDEAIRVWDIEKRRVLITIHHARPSPLDEGIAPDEVAVSADDRLAALCTDSGSLQIWRVDTGRRVSDRWIEDASPSACSRSARLSFTPGRSDRLVAVTGDGIRMWDTDSGKELPSIPHDAPRGVALSADGAYLALYGATEIRLWRLGAEPRMVFAFTPRQETVADLRIDEAQGVLRYLAASGGKTMRLRTVAFDNVTATSRWRAQGAHSAQFGPDGALLLRAVKSGGKARFELRRTGDGTRRALTPAPCPGGERGACTVLLAFAPDGGTLAYGTTAGTVTDELPPGSPVPPPGDAEEVPPDTEIVSVPGGEGVPDDEGIPYDEGVPDAEGMGDSDVPPDDLPHDDVTREEPADVTETEEADTSLDSPSAWSGTVRLWDSARGRHGAMVDILSGPEDFLADGIALSSGSLLVHRVDDYGWERWDVRERERVRRYDFPPSSAGGTASVDLVGSDAPARSLALRPDGRLMVTATGRVTDLRSRRTENRSLSPEEIEVVRFSPRGDRLAVGDRTGWVRVWDGAAERRLGLFAGTLKDEPWRRAEAVTALAFSPDGDTLAVGGADGTLRLWDVASARPLGSPLPTSGDRILDLAFAADGGTLLATGEHVPLRIHPVHPERVTATVCRRAGGGPTREEWRTYLPEIPYQRVC